MSEAWFEKSFGSDYMLVYKHRDIKGAYEEVRTMMEWLELAEGSEVLDLCCGMGRHSLALVDFGFKLTGVDLSETLLNEARRLDVRHEIKWVRGDMRNIPLTGPYDAVVNLFTSFGYFDDDQDSLQVLREMERLLRPQGKFIIDYLNPIYVKAHLIPTSERVDGKITIKERRCIEDGFVKKTITLIENEDKRTYEEQVRLYDQSTFLEMLRHSGLHVEKTYGGYDGSVYHAATSSRMIFIGHKPNK